MVTIADIDSPETAFAGWLAARLIPNETLPEMNTCNTKKRKENFDSPSSGENQVIFPD
jgi:hypothetical protein